ncbi:hypothetical protein ACHHYP_07163 [Achlya hypogyna]|uniref:Secreted protein n=1 Tax=Achlya hypogyna TaxID=1202772 RepID=A0A1V9ZMH9_ACHHY|nr:hypothetical protein ACHHYP_07163 [Achlya hypogyna]
MAFLFRLLGDLFTPNGDAAGPTKGRPPPTSKTVAKKPHQYQAPVSRPVETASYATDYFDAIVELSNYDEYNNDRSSISDIMDFNDPLTPSPMPSSIFSKQYWPAQEDSTEVSSARKWNSLSKPDAFVDQILIASTQAVNHSVNSQAKSELARELLQCATEPEAEPPRSLPRLQKVSPQVSQNAPTSAEKVRKIKQAALSRRRGSKWLFEYQDSGELDLNSFYPQQDSNERLSNSFEMSVEPPSFDVPPAIRSAQKSLSTRNHALSIAKEMSSRNTSKLQHAHSDEAPAEPHRFTRQTSLPVQTSQRKIKVPPVEPSALPIRYTKYEASLEEQVPVSQTILTATPAYG